MSEENTATPVEASASAEPMTEAAADSLFAAAGDGKTAPPQESVKAETPPPVQEPEAKDVPEPIKPVTPDPVKAAEDRAAQIERDKQSRIIAEEAERIQKLRAESVQRAPAASDLPSLEKALLDGELKDFKIKSMKDGQEVEIPLSDFLDDEKGYGEVARGTMSLATAIAKAITAPLQAKIEAMESEKVRAAADAEHESFIGKIAEETAHKDVADIEKSEALWKWLNTQTPQMQALASSKDIRDIDLLLSAFKSATGYKSNNSAVDRAEVVNKQKAARERSDKVLRSTTSGRNASPSSDGGESIETMEDAEKLFNQAASKALR